MILAIDVGTTFLKVAIIDFTGKIYFSEKRVIDLSFDKDTREVDPAKWESGLTFLCSSIPSKYVKQIESIVVSGNGPTFIPVDNLGKPVGNALLWVDDRALTLVDEIREKLGEYLPPNFFLSKAYWFKKEQPDLYAKTKYFLSCPEYISFLLTGKVFTLLPDVGFTNYYWTNTKIEKLGLDKNKFPEFISPFDAYGKLNNSKVISGAVKGIPVICAGPDFTMSVLGTGAVSEGIICDRTGTSEGINYCSSSPVNIHGLRTLPHIVTGLYTVAGLIPSSGDYLLTDRVDQLIIEYKSIIDLMISSGLNIKEIRVIGGHSGIEKLNRLKAESFDIPLKIYHDGSDLIGNAVLGSVVCGFYKSIEEACALMVREKLCYNI